MTAYLKKPELLAPAGRKDVFQAVLEAGADAVYVSGKHFNMRRHRKDFHFSDDDLREVVAYAHSKHRKVYVTVNILVGEREITLLLEYLNFLKSIHVDAIIVQDHAIARLCQENAIDIPLHASTMMNVNSIEAAAFLKKYGFTRVVSSRDITIEEVGRIREATGLEVEYFVHGDMCTAQSGHCYGSGIIFGKSSNRGQCLKPCRWAYDLVSERSGETIRENAYVLASKDMCLVEHVPDFIDAGISSFKIEGRMKSSDILVPIVKAYRTAIDRYVDDPLQYARDFSTARTIQQNRVRDLTTGFSFKTPSADYIDFSGEREPIFLSYSGKQSAIAPEQGDIFGAEGVRNTPAITCVVGTFASAIAAAGSGARTIVLSWEGDLTVDHAWRGDDIRNIIAFCREKDVECFLATPKILTRRELKEFYTVVDHYGELDGYVISSPAPLDFLRGKGKAIWADHTMNVMNSRAAALLRDEGVTTIMPSLEISFEDLRDMIAASTDVAFDVFAHGPVIFMLIEHCIVAMNIQGISKKDFCTMPCVSDEYALIDKTGQRRRIRTDKYCRNHMFMEHDITILPSLASFLTLGAKSVRIDSRLYSADETAFLVRLFSHAITEGAPRLGGQVDQLYDKFPGKKFSYGAYIRGITNDDERSLFSLKKEESHA